MLNFKEVCMGRRVGGWRGRRMRVKTMLSSFNVKGGWMGPLIDERLCQMVLLFAGWKASWIKIVKPG
jgi:hypothetical protein